MRPSHITCSSLDMPCRRTHTHIHTHAHMTMNMFSDLKVLIETGQVLMLTGRVEPGLRVHTRLGIGEPGGGGGGALGTYIVRVILIPCYTGI